MSAFGITPASTTVPLDAQGQGVASFTVSNETGHTVRVRASATITGALAADPTWLLGPDRPERDLPVEGSDQFNVAISVPAGAPGGAYQFRLDAISVALPDDEWAHGPDVTFVVAETPVEPDTPPDIVPVVRKGYRETLVGALLGGFAGGLGAGLIGVLLLVVVGSLPSDAVDLGDVIGLVVLAALLAMLGVWVGSAVGAYLVLKAQGFLQPLRTALPLAFFLPFWATLLLVMASRAPEGLSDGVLGLVLVLVAVLLIITVPALAGRALFRFRTTGGL